MTPQIAHYLPDLEARYMIDHGLRDAFPGGIDGLEWRDVHGGIEAETDTQKIRVDDDYITVSNLKFGSSKRIPLK